MSVCEKEYNSFDEYPVREDALTEMEYSPAETKFSLWAPTAEEVRVLLFESGNEGSASNTFPMEMGENGTWNISIKEDLKGKFYTFNVKVNGKWLGDTPGIMAKAVGVMVSGQLCLISVLQIRKDGRRCASSFEELC